MKIKEKINLLNLALIILLIAIGLLIYLIRDLRQTEKHLADSLINKTMNYTKMKLDNLFSVSESVIDIISEQVSMGVSIEDEGLMIEQLSPTLAKHKHLRYIVFVTPDTFEYAVFIEKGKIIDRMRRQNKWGPTAFYKSWELDSASYSWKKEKEWQIEEFVDPTFRMWYKGAMKSESRELFWSGPFKYPVTGELGLAISRKWTQPGEQKYNIIGLGILLTQISEYTQQLRISPNGQVFILSDQGKYIGLPLDERLSDEKEIVDNLLKHVDSTELKIQAQQYNYWKTTHKQDETSFKFDFDNEKYWGSIVKLNLSQGKHVLIGITIPESDILSELSRTKRIIIGSFIFILMLTSFLLYSYNQTKKANIVLDAKNIEISKKNAIIEEKNKDIIDSLNYASRLQFAILPTQELMQKTLKNYFVLYKPKDVVAGDFYWMETKDDTLYLAAADCTGHGVPGAMVSVVCINALNRSLLELNLTDPGQILDKTREIVIKVFEKSKEDVNDGMDIALITLKGNSLRYAGAYNPLWMIRNGELSETKADKQPIGLYNDPKLYTTHTIEVQPGDSFYMFSDGFADQFGGELGKKFKSKSFKKLLLGMQDKSMEEQGQILEKEFNDWKGSSYQVDDVCVIGIKL